MLLNEHSTELRPSGLVTGPMVSANWYRMGDNCFSWVAAMIIILSYLYFEVAQRAFDGAAAFRVGYRTDGVGELVSDGR